jgi:hypothetical protein
MLLGVQDLIRALPGVISTRVGYTGGDNEDPTYRNHPGHAEAVEITYEKVLRSVKCDFHPALMNTERAESANLITVTTGASINLATKGSRTHRCGESAIKPNRLEMS